MSCPSSRTRIPLKGNPWSFCLEQSSDKFDVENRALSLLIGERDMQILQGLLTSVKICLLLRAAVIQGIANIFRVVNESYGSS